MSGILSIEKIQLRSEYPVINFRDYVSICNCKNDGSRRRGILSAELYKEIIDDPDTIFINSNNYRIPLLMGIDHGIAMGYDSDKCREYANGISYEIKILTLPFHELNEDEKDQAVHSLLSDGSCTIYFGDHNNDESRALLGTLEKFNAQQSEVPIIDSRAAKGDEQAALFLYALSAEQSEDRGERKKLSLSDAWEYYNEHMGTSYSSEGNAATSLCMGDKISDLQAEEMWNLYNDRFDFLGEGHPISMQDSKESFFKLLRSDRTMVAATRIKGENESEELACFTYFNDNIADLYWLNQKYLEDEFVALHADQSYMTNIFTPGIVSLE